MYQRRQRYPRNDITNDNADDIASDIANDGVSSSASGSANDNADTRTARYAGLRLWADCYSSTQIFSAHSSVCVRSLHFRLGCRSWQSLSVAQMRVQ